jgi:hypothetical protein
VDPQSTQDLKHNLYHNPSLVQQVASETISPTQLVDMENAVSALRRLSLFHDLVTGACPGLRETGARAAALAAY